MTTSPSVPQRDAAQELIYKTVNDQPLELSFRPPTRRVYDRAPVYFLIPGGGWHSESRASMLDFSRLSAALLREQGFAVVGVDYRVTSTAPGATIDDEVSDVMDAARYLAHYADTLEINSRRLVTSGHSAGGHLALMLALAPHDRFRRNSVLTDDFAVAACAAISPIALLYPGGACPTPMFFDSDGLYVDGVYDDEAAHRCSPYDYITADSAPTLFIHGTHDQLVNFENSRVSYCRGVQLGADFELVTPQNGGHGLESRVEGAHTYPSFDTIQRLIAAWVVGAITQD